MYIYGVKLRWRNKQVCTLEEYTNIRNFPILFVKISNQHIEKNGEKKELDRQSDKKQSDPEIHIFIYIYIRLLFLQGHRETDLFLGA